MHTDSPSNGATGNGGSDIKLDLVDLHALDFDYKCNSNTAYQMLLVGGYVSVKYYVIYQFENTNGIYRHVHIDLTEYINLIQHVGYNHDLKLAIWNLKPLYTGDNLHIRNLQINAFDIVNVYEKPVQSPLIGQISDSSVVTWGATEYVVRDHKLMYTAPSDGNNGFCILPSKRSNIDKIRLYFNVNSKADDGAMQVHIWDGISPISGHFYTVGTVTKTCYIDVDLAYIAVYLPTIDISNWIVLISNASSFHSGVFNFDAIEIRDNAYEFDQKWENKSGIEVLSNILWKINAMPNVIDRDIMVMPSGKKVIMQVSDNGTIELTPVIPSKQLFIGNSLLNAFGGFGMAASNYQRDYFYYISEYIKALEPTYTSTKVGGAPFEQCESVQSANSWMTNTLLPYLDSDLELVTIQLGDNVNNTERIACFPTNCLNLLKYIRENCPKARVVWIGTWYAISLHPVIVSSCQQTGCEFIDFYDLSRSNDNCGYIGKVYDLGTVETRTFTIERYTDDAVNHKLTVTIEIDGTEYTSVLPYVSYSVNGSTLTVQTQYSIITSSGVASHPGDKGMARIANRVLYKLGIALSEDVIPIPDNR